jgi:mannose-6-phosphate isomerase-like protein (cupin superfamily)
MEVINLQDKFGRFDSLWDPKIAAELNESYVKLAKVRGEFVWHRHEAEDELFLVVRGRLAIDLRDRTLELNEGDFCVIPRGVEHRPRADEEAQILMIEPKSTLNTGEVRDERTRERLDWI